MRRYTAAEAIGPAWEHTTTLLWRNGRLATGLKIAFVAILAEMSLGFNWTFWNRNANAANASHSMQHVAAGVAIFIGFLIFLVGIIMLYIGSRLQLALYDMITHRSLWVAPSWSKYGSTVWRWIGLKLVLLAGMLAVTVPASIVFALRMARLTANGMKPGPGAVFSHLLPFLAIVLSAGLIFAFFYWAVRDFVMPSLALEDTTLGFALYRFRLFLAAEPAPIITYLFLRLILSILFGIATYIGLIITILLSAIPFAIVTAIVWMPVRNAGTGVHVAAGAFLVLLGLVFAVVAVLLAIVFFGTLVTFYYSWAAYFLGGRYPVLGDLLEPAIIPAPFTPPPSFPTNDDANPGDPDLPLNPQPAS